MDFPFYSFLFIRDSKDLSYFVPKRAKSAEYIVRVLLLLKMALKQGFHLILGPSTKVSYCIESLLALWDRVEDKIHLDLGDPIF